MRDGLSAADILAINDAKPECVEVPEWGGCVYIRAMTGAERAAYNADVYDDVGEMRKDKRGTWITRALVDALCDEGGNKLFTAEQVAELNKKNAKVLQRLHIAALRINALREEDIVAMGKPSEPTQSEDSTSD